MKKLFSIALLAILITTTAFATSETKVSYVVKTSFRSDFGEIKDVSWGSVSNYTTASFMQDNKQVTAFYTHKGELIGSSHPISMDEIPASAKRVFAKKYADYNATEAIRFETKEEFAYFISAKNENNQRIFKIENGSVSIYK